MVERKSIVICMLKKILFSFRRQARSALKLKSQSIFEEAIEAQERLAQQQEEKLKQRALCEQLANQVRFVPRKKNE